MQKNDRQRERHEIDKIPKFHEDSSAAPVLCVCSDDSQSNRHTTTKSLPSSTGRGIYHLADLCDLSGRKAA